MLAFTSIMLAFAAPMSVGMASIEFLLSAGIAPMFSCMTPMRSKIRSAVEPGREMRDKGAALASTIERCRSDKVDERPDSSSVTIVYYNARTSVRYIIFIIKDKVFYQLLHNSKKMVECMT